MTCPRLRHPRTTREVGNKRERTRPSDYSCRLRSNTAGSTVQDAFERAVKELKIDQG